MEIRFQSKEESNKKQEEAFLKLTPIERIYSFLNLMELVNRFPTKTKQEKKGNFVIEFKTEKQTVN